MAEDKFWGNPPYNMEQIHEALTTALGIIFWMSGSGDFSPGGQAHEGWLKAQPDIEKIRAAVALFAAR